MNGADLNVSGRCLTLFPRLGGDYEKIREACYSAGARYDGALKRYVIPIRSAPDLLRSALAHGVRLFPRAAVSDALRLEASELRKQAEFLERVCDGVALYPFQSEGVGYLWHNPAALLFDEMGLGKTVQALMAIDGPTLIIGPRIVKSVWQREAKRWRPDLKFTDLSGPIKYHEGRVFRWPEPGEIVFITYGLTPEVADLKKVGPPWPNTELHFDEGHYAKNAHSQRTRRARVMANRVRKYNGRVKVMTGTPLQNKPEELWSLLVLLQLHKSAYGSFSNFAKLFGGVKDGFGYVFDGTAVTPQATSILSSLAMRRERKDVLQDLPSNTFEVETPDDRTLIRLLDSVDQDLLDIALDDEMQLGDVAGLPACRQELAVYKAEQAEPFIAEFEAQSEPVVVFSAHRAPAEMYGAREGWGLIMGGVSDTKRSRIIDAFQAGELRGIAATIQAAGVGITLTKAHHAVFIDRTFVPGDNLQAEDRICRIGQDRGCIITDIEVEHPIDQRVNAILRRKERLIEATTGRIAEDRKPVLDYEKLAQELERIATMVEGKRQ